MSELWLATSGGLVRCGADGQPRVFATANGLPFHGTIWAPGVG